MPLISITLPTHRRPHLLETAIASVVGQVGFDDFELVVSDNSADACAEETVQKFKDPRVRYVNTGKELDVYASWNFAVDQARGRYTFLFADDDAFLPDGLERIHAALQRYAMPQYLGLSVGWYARPTFLRGKANSLRVDEKFAREGLAEPEQLLKEYFGFGRPSASATYVLLDEAVRQRIRERGLPIYLPLFPDYALQGMALALCDSAANMKEPTLLHGYASESLGEHYCYPRKNIAWPAPAGETSVFRHSPVSGYTFSNGWLETMLRVQAALPEVGMLDIDAVTFMRAYAGELLSEGTWRDTSADTEQFLQYLEQLPQDGSAEVFATIGQLVLQLHAMLETQPWKNIRVGPDEWLRGDEYGFTDILGAAAQAADIYERKRRRASELNELVRLAQDPGIVGRRLAMKSLGRCG